jgi:hypothetical protein
VKLSPVNLRSTSAINAALGRIPASQGLVAGSHDIQQIAIRINTRSIFDLVAR